MFSSDTPGMLVSRLPPAEHCAPKQCTLSMIAILLSNIPQDPYLGTARSLELKTTLQTQQNATTKPSELTLVCARNCLWLPSFSLSTVNRELCFDRESAISHCSKRKPMFSIWLVLFPNPLHRQVLFPAKAASSHQSWFQDRESQFSSYSHTIRLIQPWPSTETYPRRPV